MERDKDQKAHKENKKKQAADLLWQEQTLKANLWSKEHSGSSSGSGSSTPPPGSLIETSDKAGARNPARSRKITGTVSQEGARKNKGGLGGDKEDLSDHKDYRDTSVDAAKERKSFMWEGSDIRTSLFIESSLFNSQHSYTIIEHVCLFSYLFSISSLDRRLTSTCLFSSFSSYSHVSCG